MKSWLKYLTRTEIIKEINSPENGLIQIIRVFDKPRMIIGGMIQSGGMVRKIWFKALNQLKKEKKTVKTALIIGLGCGDCAFEIREIYPEVRMTGVEIDKEVVNMAECYFNLATVKNLNISVDDGAKWVERKAKQKKPPKYDLVIVDVYLGRTMPKSFRTKKFFQALKKLLKTDGVVIINHLFFKEYKKMAEELIEILEPVFSKIKLQRVASNLLIRARL